MNILIATGIYPPEIGGPATYTPEIARGLKEKGHHVEVITYSDRARYDFDGSYSFPLTRIVRKGKLSNYVRFFWAVWRRLKHYDCVYTLGWVAAGLPVRVAARLRGKPYIVRVGGGYIWERYLNEGREPLTLRDFYKKERYKEYPTLYKLINGVLSDAGAVIFNSPEQRELFWQHYDLEAKKLYTIYNPKPPLSFSIPKESSKKVFSFTGRFIVMKNVENLVRAFARAGVEEYKLLLMGDGSTLLDIKKLAEELNVEERVTFLPPRRREEMWKVIGETRALFQPSWTDISPNLIVEALALGIPFVITRENYLPFKSEIPNMVDPYSIEGIADAMKRMADEEEYRQHRRRLSEIEYDYSWDEAVNEHIEIFKQYTS